jgi:cytochrome c oxidase subunit 1
VLVLCWLFTLWKGKLSFEPPMLFALGFIAMFVIGGIDGVWMASPAADFTIHDTYFVVSHIHYVLLGGSLFGIFAAMYYWFPKISGRMLSRRLGQWHFWLLLISFNVTFFPMHFLGLWGMPRRVATYPISSGWGLTNFIETISAYVIALSMLIALANLIITLRRPRNAPADPWGGNTLEWATTSPPPPHNFDALPEIRSERPVRDLRIAISAASKAAPAGPLTGPKEEAGPYREAPGVGPEGAQ